MTAKSPRAREVLLLVSGIALIIPTVLNAQAWTPEKGKGSVSLSYEYVVTRYHLIPFSVEGRIFGPYVGGPGKKLHLGNTTTQSVKLDFDYRVIDRLAVTGTVVYLGREYDGTLPHPSEADDGSYHPSFQDAYIGIRYMALQKPLAVTPFIGYRFPTQDYPTFGHASHGRHLREFRVGSSLARNLSPILLEAYLLGTYSYSFVE